MQQGVDRFKYQPGTAWEIGAAQFYYFKTWDDLVHERTSERRWLSHGHQFLVLETHPYPTSGLLDLAIRFQQLGGTGRSGWMPLFSEGSGLRRVYPLPLFVETLMPHPVPHE